MIPLLSLRSPPMLIGLLRSNIAGLRGLTSTFKKLQGHLHAGIHSVRFPRRAMYWLIQWHWIKNAHLRGLKLESGLQGIPRPPFPHLRAACWNSRAAWLDSHFVCYSCLRGNSCRVPGVPVLAAAGPPAVTPASQASCSSVRLVSSETPHPRKCQHPSC